MRAHESRRDYMKISDQRARELELLSTLVWPRLNTPTLQLVSKRKITMHVAGKVQLTDFFFSERFLLFATLLSLL